MHGGLRKTRFPISTAATLACVWEATAPKPGNVHRGADFEDVTYLDFVQSAIVVGPILAQTRELGVGRTVLEAVRATKAAVQTNTNLGAVLLLAPLAAVPDGTPHADGIRDVLNQLTAEDTRYVYEAIRISSAGGLGHAESADVFDEPPNITLVDAMRLAAHRDLVARQYAHQFADIFDRLAIWIETGVAQGGPLTTAIVHAQLRQLAAEVDSLILRKCGQQLAESVRVRASATIAAGKPGDETFERAVADLDFWLRADGHRRNPGTTADLIAAALFVLLREGRLNWTNLRAA
ncbi:MAG: triphosphoribosyl-dephospho-CoA synthase [Pirellulales bacterium]|nr:triphosphoribosyl-dephospho-CoA synthase [Pirellulales bacterium]